jgi:hypothetical protein
MAKQKSSNLCLKQSTSDYEFAQHIQTQIACEKERLLKLKLSAESTKEEEQNAEEMINMLEELISPLRESVLVDVDNLYLPTCIGVISKWPWYTLLKDWLCLLSLAIQESVGDVFPFERYVINLIEETPLPPPGKLEISIPFGSFSLYCSRPPLNTCQLVKNVKSF